MVLPTVPHLATKAVYASLFSSSSPSEYVLLVFSFGVYWLLLVQLLLSILFQITAYDYDCDKNQDSDFDWY